MESAVCIDDIFINPCAILPFSGNVLAKTNNVLKIGIIGHPEFLLIEVGPHAFGNFDLLRENDITR